MILTVHAGGWKPVEIIFIGEMKNELDLKFFREFSSLAKWSNGMLYDLLGEGHVFETIKIIFVRPDTLTNSFRILRGPS